MTCGEHRRISGDNSEPRRTATKTADLRGTRLKTMVSTPRRANTEQDINPEPWNTLFAKGGKQGESTFQENNLKREKQGWLFHGSPHILEIPPCFPVGQKQWSVLMSQRNTLSKNARWGGEPRGFLKGGGSHGYGPMG